MNSSRQVSMPQLKEKQVSVWCSRFCPSLIVEAVMRLLIAGDSVPVANFLTSKRSASAVIVVRHSSQKDATRCFVVLS